MAEVPITVHAGESHFARDEFMVWRPHHDSDAFRTCGYCGSLHPEDFASAEVAQGGRVELADMKYGWPHKVYIDLVNPDPERLHAIGASYPAAFGPYAPGGEKYTPPGDGYVAWDDLTPEHLEIVRRDRIGEGRHPSHVYFGTRPSVHAKFYTVHLLEPGLDRAVTDRCFARIGLVIEPGDSPGTVRWRPYDYGAKA